MAVAAVLACGSFAVFRTGVFRRPASPAEILGPLPASARLIQHGTLRHGLDRVHLFVFVCADRTLRDTLVRRWRLQELTAVDEDPVSFVGDDRPKWWPTRRPAGTRCFARSDEKAETYFNLWEPPSGGRLYIEVGRW